MPKATKQCNDQQQQVCLFSVQWRMHYVALAQVLILLSLANGSPVIAKRIFGAKCAAPVDGNTPFIDGRPLFGPSKTIRGIVVSLVVTALGAILLGLHFWIGLLVAGASMAGVLVLELFEAPNPPRPQQQGNWTHQLPKSLFPLLACQPLLSLTAIDIAVGCAVFFCGAIATLPSLFLAAIARPPLLMTRLPRHAAGGAE